MNQNTTGTPSTGPYFPVVIRHLYGLNLTKALGARLFTQSIAGTPGPSHYFPLGINHQYAVGLTNTPRDPIPTHDITGAEIARLSSYERCIAIAIVLCAECPFSVTYNYGGVLSSPLLPWAVPLNPAAIPNRMISRWAAFLLGWTFGHAHETASHLDMSKNEVVLARARSRVATLRDAAISRRLSHRGPGLGGAPNPTPAIAHAGSTVTLAGPSSRPGSGPGPGSGPISGPSQGARAPVRPAASASAHQSAPVPTGYGESDSTPRRNTFFTHRGFFAYVNSDGSINTTETSVDGPEGTFWRFPRLPAEIRLMIFQQAMVLPAVNHYQLTHALLDPSRPATRFPRPTPRCHSSWREWRVLGSSCREAAHAVNLVVTRAGAKHYLDSRRRAPFDKEVDLVTFELAVYMYNYSSLPPDYVYELFGRGLRRVAIKYEPKKYRCFSGHRGQVGDCDGKRWGPRYFDIGDFVCRDRDACKAPMCRYIPWFRDAEVIYLSQYLILSSIKQEVRSQVGTHKALKHVVDVFRRMRKAMDLEIWEDSANTFIEVDYDVAASVVDHDHLGAWRTARYLQRYVGALDPPRKAVVNPKMKIKVLVTMWDLRWNPINMHNMRRARY